MTEARKKLAQDKNWEIYFRKVLYRPFDERWAYYTPQMVDWPRLDIASHLDGNNISMICCRQQSETGFQHVFCSQLMSDDSMVSNKSKERGYVLPLFQLPSKTDTPISLFDKSSTKPSPNISEKIVEELQQKLKKKCTPERFFAYVYAVLHSPKYRIRYAEFLQSDFPRIPITSKVKLFDGLAKLGQDLIDLHLLKSKKLEKSISKFYGNGETKVDIHNYDEKKHAVWINDRQRFEGIPTEVWEYQIDGYQVLDKWIKDRKDHTLTNEDIRHYCRVVTALAETIKTQREIDEIIKKNGDFPIQ